jgi:SpoVK/Ycf46/Vps4 family AAA+-type ATPase
VVANQLAAFLEPARAPTNASTRPISATPGDLVDEVEPGRKLADLVLPAAVRQICSELVEEQARAELLRSHGLEPRHRILLIGPPGNGKTSLAEAIAGELYVPVLRVRYDAVIGSYLGETANRLSRLFDHARTRQCVLFFDEFDAVGKERGDEHETGEIKRVVNSLLMSIDALPPYVTIVAASNHPELLDRAVWRRFQIRVELPPPDPAATLAWIRSFEERSGLKLGLTDRAVREHLQGLSYAELEEFCRDVLRRIVLDGPDAKPASIARSCLKHWIARGAVRKQ